MKQKELSKNQNNKKSLDECLKSIKKIENSYKLFYLNGEYGDSENYEKLCDIFIDYHIQGFVFIIDKLDYLHQGYSETLAVSFEDFNEKLSMISDFKNGVDFYILNETDIKQKTLACLLHGQNYSINNKFFSIETLVRIIPIDDITYFYTFDNFINQNKHIPELRSKFTKLNEDLIKECTETFDIKTQQEINQYNNSIDIELDI